jgi:hypothetical protein
MCDIVGSIYTRNTTKSATLERVGWPILQENFTDILKLNKHNNWEFQLNLEDMIISGTPDSLELVDYYYTNYQITVNKNKVYRETYYRCLAIYACRTVLPDKNDMINANYDYFYQHKFLDG